MKILLLAHSFNSLSQRLHVELRRMGHEVSVELDVNDDLVREAAALFAPDLVLAPYLRRAIPEDVWRKKTCLVVHPGPEGDRGPSALDWAVLEGAPRWGVTVFQAEAEMDAGPVWATAGFPLRAASKSSIYRNEVAEATTAAVLEASGRLERGGFTPARVPGTRRPLMTQSDRSVDWTKDDAAAVIRKINASDGWPGVQDEVLGREVFLYDARPAAGSNSFPQVHAARPGDVLGACRGAICRAAAEGSVWIGQMRPRRADGPSAFKLPSTAALGQAAAGLPELKSGPDDISYEEKGEVGYLSFGFYNGAMGVSECRRLASALLQALRRPTKVVCLLGGPDSWSNGIHLNLIEAAESPADESWRNIQAMNDLVREIVNAAGHVTVSALRGSCAAGGCFLAIAADFVVAREGVVLNPHYKSMGNLYGSEYWTYNLPRRAGARAAERIMSLRLPMGGQEALSRRLVDEVWPSAEFESRLHEFARRLAADSGRLLEEKRSRRERDEAARPLEDYRREELERMKFNFYGFDPSYHVARHHFVHKTPKSWTPVHLARHRDKRG
ncbi:MAG: hydrogenase maturation protein [Elusimicrobia bacterium]|nr:hydrogenase maturation protein [Elusimicrobiota bacterium]